MKKTILPIFCILLMLPIAFAGTVTRSVSNSNPTSGSTVTVTLTYSGGDRAVTMHDEAPFTIIETSNQIYESAYVSQGTLTAKTDTYTFVAGATGVKTFSGVYRINGAATDTATLGVNSITVGGSCTSTGVYTPDTSTVCSGQSFTQTDNCGATRQSTGTKTCTVADCTNKNCGSDGIGGSCGTCTTGYSCSASGTCVADQQATTCSANSDCQFYEKCNTGKCENDTNKIIMYAIGLIVGIIALKSVFK